MCHILPIVRNVAAVMKFNECYGLYPLPTMCFCFVQTVLRSGEPISQLAYVEVHLQVTDTGHVSCRLVRRTQHAKALQALGLQKDSAAAGGDADADAEEPSIRTPIKLIQTDEPELSSTPRARQLTAWTKASDASLQKPEPDGTTPKGQSTSHTTGAHDSVKAGVDTVVGDTVNTVSGGVSEAPTAQKSKAGSVASRPEAVDADASLAQLGQSPAAAASSLDWPAADAPASSSAPLPNRQVA